MSKQPKRPTEDRRRYLIVHRAFMTIVFPLFRKLLCNSGNFIYKTQLYKRQEFVNLFISRYRVEESITENGRSKCVHCLHYKVNEIWLAHLEITLMGYILLHYSDVTADVKKIVHKLMELRDEILNLWSYKINLSMYNSMWQTLASTIIKLDNNFESALTAIQNTPLDEFLFKAYCHSNADLINDVEEVQEVLKDITRKNMTADIEITSFSKLARVLSLKQYLICNEDMFVSLIEKYKHVLFHFCDANRCCQCSDSCILPKSRIVKPKEMKKMLKIRKGKCDCKEKGIRHSCNYVGKTHVDFKSLSSKSVMLLLNLFYTDKDLSVKNENGGCYDPKSFWMYRLWETLSTLVDKFSIHDINDKIIDEKRIDKTNRDNNVSETHHDMEYDLENKDPRNFRFDFTHEKMDAEIEDVCDESEHKNKKWFNGVRKKKKKKECSTFTVAIAKQNQTKGFKILKYTKSKLLSCLGEAEKVKRKHESDACENSRMNVNKIKPENSNYYSDDFDVSKNRIGKTTKYTRHALISVPVLHDNESCQCPCYDENKFEDVPKHEKVCTYTSVSEAKDGTINNLHLELEQGPSKCFRSDNTHENVISDLQPTDLQPLEELFKEDSCLDIDQLRNDDLGDVKTSESTELISIERNCDSGSLCINLDSRSEKLSGTTMSLECSCMSCYGLSNDAPDSIPQSLESFDNSFDNQHMFIDEPYQDVHAKQSKENVDVAFIDLSGLKMCHTEVPETTGATYFQEQNQNFTQYTTLESIDSGKTSQHLEVINILKTNDKFTIEHGSEIQFLDVHNDQNCSVNRKLEDICKYEKLKDPAEKESKAQGHGQIETIGHNDSYEAIQARTISHTDDLNESCITKFKESAKIDKFDAIDILYCYIPNRIFDNIHILDHPECTYILKSICDNVNDSQENGKKNLIIEIFKNPYRDISLYFPYSAVQRDFLSPTPCGFGEDLVNKTQYVQTEGYLQILKDSCSCFSSKSGIEEFCYISVHPNEVCKLWYANIALRSTRHVSEFICRHVKTNKRRIVSSQFSIENIDLIKCFEAVHVSEKTIDTDVASLQTKTEKLYQIQLGNTEPSIPLELKEFITFMKVNAKEEENNKEMSQQLKQLLRKFNVKAAFAEKKMKLSRSKMKHILKHTRRLTLEQLMQHFFKNLAAEIPDKGMKESSNKLLNHIFNYLPIRYESKLYVFPINGLQQYFEQMSVPLSSRPAHAETMKFEWVRVRSFWSFPSNIKVSPIAMARVGFYYTGKCAECRCFSCGHVYKEWKDGDDPYLIHQQISPTCFYLNGRESGNVPIHEEDRITPRHNVEQNLVSVAAPFNAARAAAEAEAVVIPGINSSEIASIPVPVLAPMQGGPLGASQSGDFSFRSPTTSSTAVTTQQASSSYFARPANPSQNVGQPAASASLQGRTSNLSSTKSSSGLPTTQSQEVTNTQQFNISGQQNMPQQSTEGSAGKPAVGLGLPPASQFSEGSVLSGPVRTSSPATVTQTPASITVPTTASTTVPTTVAVSSTPTAVTVSSTQPSQATLTTSTTSNTGGISRSPSSSSTSQTAAPVQTTTTTTTSASSNTASSSSTTVGSESSRSRFDPLGINFEKPRYPAYAVLTVRVNTYNGWPSYLDQTPRTMSLAGFFYAGYGDYTRCFFCGGGLRNWEAGDDPWVEHARWFPKCAFLRQNRGEDFINMVQTRHQEAESTNQPIFLPRQLSVLDQGSPSNVMSSIPVQTLREMGKEDGIINEAIDRWRAARRQEGRGTDNMEIQATAIFEIILQIEDERAQTTTQASSLLPVQTSSQLSIVERNEPAAGAEGTATELPSYLQGFDKILDEYEEQKERLTCTICTENPVAIAFLPCGHLVCCLDCAPAMRKCPICNELVKGTIKTFFP